MTTDENIMAEMLDRATNPARESVDELGVQMFCMVVRSNAQLVHRAQEMLVEKISSQDVTEATRAVALLEECMTKCGSEFRDEVAKFRFLNNLIRLVSKKYHGAETSPSIKQRILECLLLWTTEFPQKTKIREAYDMLRIEGCTVGETQSGAACAFSSVPPKRESVLGKDEEVLAKLINSGDPENYRRANLLIQYRVNQEARRTDLVLQHRSELSEVQETVEVLNQMLDAFEANGSAAATVDGDDTRSLIRDLYVACKRHKPVMQRLPELIESADEDLTAETLVTNDLLQAAILRYKNTVAQSPNLAAPAAVAPKASNQSAELLTALLGDVLPTPLLAPGQDSPSRAPMNHALDELCDIFGSPAEPAAGGACPVNSLDLLEPLAVFATPPPQTNGNALCSEERSPEKNAFRELREIDELSEELLRESLQSKERVRSFKKGADKVSLNELVRERCQTKAPQDLATARQEPKEDTSPLEAPLEDEAILGAVEAPEQAPAEDAAACTAKPVKHLSEIEIDLDAVTPSAEERLLLEDEDMKVTLSFTEDRPSLHVSVIVVSVLNKSKLPVNEFQFEASVKKPSKVRLLPPTASAMSAFRPFRPPAPINQVMLLLNPTGHAVDVTCIVGYRLGDDPDPIKESVVAQDIPFVE